MWMSFQKEQQSLSRETHISSAVTRYTTDNTTDRAAYSPSPVTPLPSALCGRLFTPWSYPHSTGKHCQTSTASCRQPHGLRTPSVCPRPRERLRETPSFPLLLPTSKTSSSYSTSSLVASFFHSPELICPQAITSFSPPPSTNTVQLWNVFPRQRCHAHWQPPLRTDFCPSPVSLPLQSQFKERGGAEKGREGEREMKDWKPIPSDLIKQSYKQ